MCILNKSPFILYVALYPDLLVFFGSTGRSGYKANYVCIQVVNLHQHFSSNIGN